jgi:succinoglycan biosynthesis transport protein ExoP
VNIVQKRPDPASPTIPPLSIARMLWKHKLLITAVAGICSAVSIATVATLPAIYKSEALVLVDSQKIPEKFVSSTVSSGVADRLAAISQGIMSTTRLLKIIQDLDLYKEERKKKTQEEIVEQMRREISVNVQKDNWATGKPVAFKVGYEGKNPSLVAEVANQLANLYIEENLQTREVEATGTSEFIETQLQEAKRQLDEQEAKVAKFKQEHNGSLPEQENPLLSTLDGLRVQLQGVQEAINRAQQNKLMLETALTTEQSAEATLERGEQMKLAGAGAVTLGTTAAPEDKTLATMQEQLQELEARYTPDFPDVVALKAQIAARIQLDNQTARAFQEQLTAKTNAAAESKEKPSPIAAPVSREILQERGKIAMLQAQLASVKHDIQSEDAERARIVQQINEVQSKVDRLPMVEQEMAGLTRDYDTSKANYKSLLDKQIAAQMSSDMERRQKSERFEIIDPARVPEKPIKPNRPLCLGIGIVLSLAIALGSALGIEFRRPVLLGEWELPEHVPVLGRVPVISMAERTRPAWRALIGTAAVGSTTAACLIAAGCYYLLKLRS